MDIHRINGKLDILGALCMLNVIQIPYINDRHTSIFLVLEPRIERIVAFFYIAIGLMKMSWSIHQNKKYIFTAYAVEFGFVLNELLSGTLENGIAYFHLLITFIMALCIMF
jgi:hypothetical protein